MDYKQMTAPCGLDCFNCPMYMASQNKEMRKKISEKISVPPSKVTKYIKENNIQPDQVRGNCKYYGPKTVKQIEKALK